MFSGIILMFCLEISFQTSSFVFRTLCLADSKIKSNLKFKFTFLSITFFNKRINMFSLPQKPLNPISTSESLYHRSIFSYKIIFGFRCNLKIYHFYIFMFLFVTFVNFPADQGLFGSLDPSQIIIKCFIQQLKVCK